MIQFNLLPDVKLVYIRTQRLKHNLITVSVLVAISSLVIAILLYLGVGVVQKRHLDSLSTELTKTAAKLRATPNIDKIITVQNQLTSLPKLHADKPAASRVFGFLSQVTPAAVAITSADVDFAAGTVKLTGTAKDLVTVNTYVDTLKFTTYTKADDKTAQPKAFSKVLLTGFSSGDKTATYEISMSYDVEIFKNQNPITTLNVPTQITTRSEVNQPTALFQTPAPTKAGSQ